MSRLQRREKGKRDEIERSRGQHTAAILRVLTVLPVIAGSMTSALAGLLFRFVVRGAGLSCWATIFITEVIMGKGLGILFEALGLVLGVYMIWPDIEFLMQASDADGGAGRLTFLEALKRGEHMLLYGALVLLPAMHLLKNYLGHKFHSALTVFLFSALCALFATSLHAALIDGYAFSITQQKAWNTIARPAAIFTIIACTWLVAFSAMYRMVKIGGK